MSLDPRIKKPKRLLTTVLPLAVVLTLGLAAGPASASMTYLQTVDMPADAVTILSQTQTPVDINAPGYQASSVEFLIDQDKFYSGEPGFLTLSLVSAFGVGVKAQSNSVTTMSGQGTTPRFIYITGIRGTLYRCPVATPSPDHSWNLTFDPVSIASTKDGSKITSIGQEGLYVLDTSTGVQSQVASLADQAFYQSFAPNDLLYILDYGNSRMLMFDPANSFAQTGEFALNLGVTTANEQFAIGPTGNLFLSDGLGGGSTYSASGTFLNFFAPTGGLTGTPHTGASYLSAEFDGMVYAYDTDNGLVHQYRDTSVVPEPSAISLLMATAAVSLRRRRSSSTTK